MSETQCLGIQDFCLSIGARVVLDHVSFSVASGEIVGILGPNGSGKTSLMRCLTGLRQPDSGTLSVGGKILLHGDRTMRAHMGVVFQEASLDDKLTARENLLLGAAMFAVSRQEAKRRSTELLAFMELSDRTSDLAGILSGGMRRRLELARALIHRPKVLLLDEPTAGLDPYAFERTWQRLLALRRTHQLTILVNTHRSDEAERCDRLIVLDSGRVVACDSPANLLATVGGDVIAVECADHPASFIHTVEQQFGLACRQVGDLIMLGSTEAHALVPRLAQTFPPGYLRTLTVRRASLADAFFKLTGRSLESAEQR